jgi:hypothetical protein
MFGLRLNIAVILLSAAQQEVQVWNSNSKSATFMYRDYENIAL